MPNNSSTSDDDICILLHVLELILRRNDRSTATSQQPTSTRHPDRWTALADLFSTMHSLLRSDEDEGLVPPTRQTSPVREEERALFEWAIAEMRRVAFARRDSLQSTLTVAMANARQGHMLAADIQDRARWNNAQTLQAIEWERSPVGGVDELLPATAQIPSRNPAVVGEQLPEYATPHNSIAGPSSLPQFCYPGLAAAAPLDPNQTNYGSPPSFGGAPDGQLLDMSFNFNPLSSEAVASDPPAYIDPASSAGLHLPSGWPYPHHPTDASVLADGYLMPLSEQNSCPQPSATQATNASTSNFDATFVSPQRSPWAPGPSTQTYLAMPSHQDLSPNDSLWRPGIPTAAQMPNMAPADPAQLMYGDFQRYYENSNSSMPTFYFSGVVQTAMHTVGGGARMASTPTLHPATTSPSAAESSATSSAYANSPLYTPSTLVLEDGSVASATPPYAMPHAFPTPPETPRVRRTPDCESDSQETRVDEWLRDVSESGRLDTPCAATPSASSSVDEEYEMSSSASEEGSVDEDEDDDVQRLAQERFCETAFDYEAAAAFTPPMR
ncbi:hypothetical protein C8Q77DRAFT_1076736 [Trametes polyzona]|nr:hypothetical protein C8Q77DRAFT_1076736 [Trametes polyzona]